MLVLCKFSIVALHLLLVTHIAHTFVLLTANVEDVKKIARKFVSDDLAEKIADFIARATETFVQQTPKSSEENPRDNSQVSAENRMYNVERHGFENLNRDEEKCKGENCKNKRKTIHERIKSKAENTDTTAKPKKETKGRSRYIIESEPKDTTTEKVSKANEEEKHNQMKKSMKFIEDNLLSGTEKSKTKKQKKKSKLNPYKLLSNLDSDDNNSVKDETPDSQQEKKKKKEDVRQRTFDDEIVLIRNAALENDNETKKAVKVPTLVRHEPEHDGNKNAKTNEEVAKSGSLVIENDAKVNWWEKDLPKQNQDDANARKKSWF